MINLLPSYESTVTSDLSMDVLRKRLKDITVKNFFSKDSQYARFFGRVDETTFRVSVKNQVGWRQPTPNICGSMMESNGKTTITLKYRIETGLLIFLSFVVLALLFGSISSGRFEMLLFGLPVALAFYYPFVLLMHWQGAKKSKEIIENILRGTSVW